jgi:hypothetical protein
MAAGPDILAIHAAFASPDQKEGMTAFIDKREPRFKHERSRDHRLRAGAKR